MRKATKLAEHIVTNERKVSQNINKQVEEFINSKRPTQIHTLIHEIMKQDVMNILVDHWLS